MLAEGASLVPSLDAGGGLVRNRCGELANVAVGSYQRSGASSKTPVVNPPLVRWGYASITKTLVGVVMQMLMANESLPHISWNDKLLQWLPLAVGTAYENASLLDVASHTACLIPDGAPISEATMQEIYQQNYLGGYPAGRAVWVNNTLQYPPLSNCIPELNTQTNYVHVDGVQILALIEETITGVDFGTLTKSLIFDPLGMSSAEVQYANPAGGLWATLGDVGLYGQWLVDGYKNHPDAIAKSVLKHQDFVDLMSPIKKHGVDQPTGRTFAMYSRHGKRVVGHGGCLGATLNLFPDDDLVVLVATTPEDAAWGTCDHTAPWAGAMYTASIQIIGAFTACDRRPLHLCTGPVEGMTRTCKLTDNFPLESSTLDVPYKATSCREEDFADRVKDALSTYYATGPDYWTKAFVVTDDCQWAINFYMLDPCESMRESFNFCAKSSVTCGVYLIGNHTYTTSDFPCRCGAWVQGSCSPSQQCGTKSVELNSSCLEGATATASTSTTSSTSSTASSTALAPPGNGMASGHSPPQKAVGSLTFLLGILPFSA